MVEAETGRGSRGLLLNAALNSIMRMIIIFKTIDASKPRHYSQVTTALRPSEPAITAGAVAAALAPPVVIGAIGALLLTMAHTQPAWLDGRIGPGLFAQWLSMGVIGLSLAWALVSLIDLWRPFRRAADDPADRVRFRGHAGPGIALLTSVCLFALLLPLAGLAAACAVTGGVAGWGAGDRSPWALGLSALLCGMIAAGIGLTLLPPTTQIWPWSPF